MGMTIGIKSSGDRDLDLHFSSSNYDGNGKWGTLHIAICAMHAEGGQDIPLQVLQCELDHADIDKLIQELQSAKALLAGDDVTPSGQYPSFVRVVGSRIVPCDENGNPNFDALCSLCGFKSGEHSYSGACIEKLPDQMIRFSKTERFT